MGFTVLFQLTFTFIYHIYNKKILNFSKISKFQINTYLKYKQEVEIAVEIVTLELSNVGQTKRTNQYDTISSYSHMHLSSLLSVLGEFYFLFLVSIFFFSSMMPNYQRKNCSGSFKIFNTSK